MTDQTPENTGAENTDPATNDETALPEWAKKELTRARNEAASYRTQLRETQGKLDTAKSPEEFAQATSELKEQLTARNRELAAAVHGLPPALVERIKGDDYDAMLADAKGLAELVTPAAPPARTPAPPANLRGGTDPGIDSQSDGVYDPKKLADEIAAAHRSLF